VTDEADDQAVTAGIARISEERLLLDWSIDDTGKGCSGRSFASQR
jgi:hypothetical protein